MSSTWFALAIIVSCWQNLRVSDFCFSFIFRFSEIVEKVRYITLNTLVAILKNYGLKYIDSDWGSIQNTFFKYYSLKVFNAVF